MIDDNDNTLFELSSTEKEERRLLSSIISILRCHSIPMNINPTLCLVGVQSHGKSSLCEYFVGFPLTLVSDGTGTRCPTKFFLQFESSISTPECSIVHVPHEIQSLHPDINGTHPLHTDISSLPSVIGKLMHDISEHSSSGFSADILEVHILSNTCPNMFFIDLPGVVSDVDPRHDVINTIVQSYLNESCVIPVMVVKASEDMATGLLYSFMKKFARPQWKTSSVFIATHFDSKLPKNGRALEYMLESHCSDPENPSLQRRITKFFVSLNPPPHIDRETVMRQSHTDLVQRIRSLDKLEREMISDTINTIKSSVHPEFNHNYWSQFLGLRNAKAAIKRQWLQCYRQQFACIRQALVERSVRNTKELDELNIAYGSCQPDTLLPTLSKLISDFVQTMKSVLTQDSRVLADSNCSFAQSGLSYANEDADFSEHGIRTPTKAWAALLSPLDLVDEESPCPQGFRDELSAKLLGSSQLRRLFRVNRSFLALCPLPTDSFATWANALTHIGSQPNWASAVAQVATLWVVQQVEPSVDFLASRVHRIFQRIAVIAADSIKLRTGKHYWQLIDGIYSHFITFLSARVDLVSQTCLHVIHAKSNWSDINLTHSVCLLTADMNKKLNQLDISGEQDDIDELQLSTSSSVRPDNIPLDTNKYSLQTKSFANNPITSYQSEEEFEEGRVDDQRLPNAIQILEEERLTCQSKRLHAFLGHDASHSAMPLSTFLDNNALKRLSGIAEVHYIAQVSFMLHDVESLFVTDLEKCIEEPEFALPVVGDSFSSWMQDLVFTNKNSLINSFTLDSERLNTDISRLSEYGRQLNIDTDSITSAITNLGKLYEV